MTRYIETFFRHKVLLLMPLVLTLLLSAWYVSKQPTTYSTSTTLWFDSQLPGPAFFDATGDAGTAPAQRAQQLLSQLLGTKDFLTKAAERGPLPAYIRAHGWSEGQMMGQLAGVTSFPAGSQVLRVALTNGDPALVTNALQAVVDQYFDTVRSIRSARGQESVDYYQPRLDEAANMRTQAEAAQIAYLRAHPEAAAVGATDPTYAALVTAASTAEKQYSDVQAAYTQAQQALSTTQTAATSHVIDPPSDIVASSKKKAAVFAGAAGLFFGLFVGLLGLIALTAADTAARRREDVETTTGDLQVVATIAEFPQERERAREARSR